MAMKAEETKISAKKKPTPEPYRDLAKNYEEETPVMPKREPSGKSQDKSSEVDEDVDMMPSRRRKNKKRLLKRDSSVEEEEADQ